MTQTKNWYVFQASYIRASKRKAAPPIRQDCFVNLLSARTMPVPSLKLSHHLQPHSSSYNQAASSFIGPCDIKITRNQALCQEFCEFLLKLSSQNHSYNVDKPIFLLVFVRFYFFGNSYPSDLKTLLLLAISITSLSRKLFK